MYSLPIPASWDLGPASKVFGDNSALGKFNQLTDYMCIHGHERNFYFKHNDDGRYLKTNFEVYKYNAKLNMSLKIVTEWCSYQQLTIEKYNTHTRIHALIHCSHAHTL